jgi:hypothetical protein
MTQIGALTHSPSFKPAMIGGLLLAGALIVGVAIVATAPRAGSPSALAGLGKATAVQVTSTTTAVAPVTNRLDSEYLRSIAATWGTTTAVAPVTNRLDSEYLRSIAAGW